MAHPELQEEQAYVDNAYEALDRMRSTLERTGDAMATEFAAVAMEAWAKRRLRTFQDADRGLCFGRLTLDAGLRPLYVGRRWVHDDQHEMLVVNWQAPAARPFYTATPADPQRVTQRRRYRTDGRRIVDISDESLDGTVVEGASVSDFLLEELERRREGRMRDIVATIQSDQYRLITADPGGALVVQGGPGTGKTAVGLHRASWLLYTHREQLRRVLVVGPNPTFMDYVSHVLPALGEEAVEQRAVSELLDRIVVTREESLDAARLKSDPRLAEVVQRAVELAVQLAPEELVLYTDGVFVTVRERHVRELLDDALGSGLALTLARERFRMALLRRFYERYGELLGAAALHSFEDIEQALRRNGFLTKYLDRVLGLPRADKLVARLLTSPAALAEASEGILDDGEQKLLLRDRPKRAADLRWSEHDLPLLDVARTLVDGPPRAYGHVIVDEAQDLSPMQLLTVSRRAVDGSLTILGDVAQATGPVVYGRWQELEPFLPAGVDVTIEELRHAYRVPGEIMDFALPLLDVIAPDVERPLAYRQGGAPPKLVFVAEDELIPTALREAAELDGLLAVIGPRSLADAPQTGETFDEMSVPVLTPRESKGLEFDHVIVVEPALIVEEGGASGLRELYVALTRPTKTSSSSMRDRYLTRSGSVTVMRIRTLGAGGPQVSVVGLGTNNFGGRCDYEQSLAVIDAALEADITLFDTADIYGQGKSEDYIGRALEGRRDRVLLATKFGSPIEEHPEERRGSRDYIRWAIEGSLRRLRTDVIDVYQLHRPDEGTPIEDTLAALHELVQEGTVRHIGSSNFSAAQLEDADRIARERGLTRFVSAQSEYSFVERDLEDEVLPVCERLGIGMLPYFPLASGLLTGKYTRGEAATEGRLAGREISEERWDRLERLQQFADERGVPLLSVAIGGLAAMPAVASVIAGATKPEQVYANVAAGEWEPSAEDVAALKALR